MRGRLAVRRLGFLALAAMALAGPLAAPARSAPKHLRVQILLPAPGHLTLESITARVRNPSAGVRSSGLLNPRLLNRGSLPPSVRIVYLRRTFRQRGSVRTTLLLLVINRASGRGAARALAAGDGPPQLVELPPKQESPDAALEHLDLFIAVQEHIAFYKQILSKVPWVAVKVSENFDLFTPKQVYLEKRTLDDLFNGHVPTDAEINSLSNENGKTDPELDTGHYDDGHAFGWKQPNKKALVNLFGSFAFGPPQSSVFKVEIVIKSDINNDRTIGPPKPQLYKFSFGPLGLTFDDTVPVQGGQPEIEHWSVQIQGGTACGTSIATAAFELPWTLSVNGGPPQQHTAQESFATNPFRFYTFNDTSNNSTLAMNLRLITGSAPSVQVEETHSGSGISNVSINPQQAAVTATPVSSTC